MSTAVMQFFETFAHLFYPRRSNNHRPRVLHEESFLSLVGLVVGFFIFILISNQLNSKLGNVLGFASDITMIDVIAQTNQERAKNGLGALTYNEQLSQAAATKAQDMFAKQYWAHQAPDGTEPWAFISGAGYQYVAAGENLARDFAITSDMVAAWMASPTHAANIMNPRYQEIGIAVVNGTLEGMETTLVVQMFGRPVTQTVAAQVSPQAAQAQEVVSVPTAPTAQTEQSVANLLPSTQESLEPNIRPVLAESAVPAGSLTNRQPIFSPTELIKAFGLSVLIMLVVTLIFDWVISHRKGTVRLVGLNLAHIIYLLTISFILLVFRGGFIY